MTPLLCKRARTVSETCQDAWHTQRAGRHRCKRDACVPHVLEITSALTSACGLTQAWSGTTVRQPARQEASSPGSETSESAGLTTPLGKSGGPGALRAPSTASGMPNTAEHLVLTACEKAGRRRQPQVMRCVDMLGWLEHAALCVCVCVCVCARARARAHKAGTCTGCSEALLRAGVQAAT